MYSRNKTIIHDPDTVFAVDNDFVGGWGGVEKFSRLVYRTVRRWYFFFVFFFSVQLLKSHKNNFTETLPRSARVFKRFYRKGIIQGFCGKLLYRGVSKKPLIVIPEKLRRVKLFSSFCRSSAKWLNDSEIPKTI